MRINEYGGDLSSATPVLGVKNELGLLESSVRCGAGQGARSCVGRCCPVRLWDQQGEGWGQEPLCHALGKEPLVLPL